jgi:hypothetical protein
VLNSNRVSVLQLLLVLGDWASAQGSYGQLPYHVAQKESIWPGPLQRAIGLVLKNSQCCGNA